MFTKQGIDTNAAKEYVYKEAGMVPAVYDKSTRYVANQKLTLEILKKILDCEDVLEIAGEYSGSWRRRRGLGIIKPFPALVTLIPFVVPLPENIASVTLVPLTVTPFD